MLMNNFLFYIFIRSMLKEYQSNTPLKNCKIMGTIIFINEILLRFIYNLKKGQWQFRGFLFSFFVKTWCLILIQLREFKDILLFFFSIWREGYLINHIRVNDQPQKIKLRLYSMITLHFWYQSMKHEACKENKVHNYHNSTCNLLQDRITVRY